MDWTPALEEMAHRMHEEGESWVDIIDKLEDHTGIRMSAGGVADYIMRRYGEK
jgi:hypothetical protein